MKIDTELEELNLEEEYNEEWEQDDDYDEEPEEPSAPMKPGTMILVFLGLVILAAIICGILWNVTHGDNGEEDNPNPAPQTAVEQSSAEQSAQGNLGAISDEEDPEELPDVDEEISIEPEDNSEPASGFEGETEGGEPEDVDKPEAADEPKSSEPQVPVSKEEPNNEASQETDANRVSTKDGRTIVFTDCDDNISPKIYTNLRLEPSTSEGNATVHCQLEYGEVVHRTGISEESGWSRVEYDGLVLYVVTSYMYVVE